MPCTISVAISSIKGTPVCESKYHLIRNTAEMQQFDALHNLLVFLPITSLHVYHASRSHTAVNWLRLQMDDKSRETEPTQYATTNLQP